MKRIIAVFLAIAIILGISSVATYATEEEPHFSLVSIKNGKTINCETPTYLNGTIFVKGKYGDFAGRKMTIKAISENDGNVCALTECTTEYQGKFSFSVTPDNKFWDQDITIYIYGTKDGDIATIQGSIVSDELLVYQRYAENLQNLINQCDEKGIPTDYEVVNLSVIQEFTKLLPIDKSSGNTERYEYNKKALDELYISTKTALEGYLSGTMTAKDVSRYVTGEQRITGKDLIAKVNDNGTIKDSPMYYLGYVYWGSPVEEVIDFSKFGTNLLLMDIGISQVIVKPSNIAGWKVRADDPWAKYKYDIESVTESAAGGRRRAKLSATGEGTMMLSQTVSVRPNTTYSFGTDVKNTGADGVWIQIGNNPRQYIDGTYDWKNVNNTYKTGINEAGLTFTLGVDNNSTGTYFDNVFIRENGSGPNLVANPGFEETISVTDEYVVNYDYIEKLNNFLSQAETNNISVILMSSAHYMPQFIYDIDNTLKNDSPSWNTFMPYNPTHPLALEIMGVYLDAILPAIANFECINSICLANEVRYYSNKSSYYLEKFKDKIKSEYSSVNSFNLEYGTSFLSFDKVTMPTDKSNLKYYNYWKEFNDSILLEWYQFMKNKIDALAPNLPIGTKQMQYVHPSGDGLDYLSGGNNYEEQSEFFDINLNDGWAYLDDEEKTLQAKIAWYDYLGSVKEAPIINAEDHILRDSVNFSSHDAELNYNLTDLWQGVLHGRTGSALWTWWPNKLEYSKNSQYTNTLLNTRADYVAEIGKTALDFQRLTPEIYAMNHGKPRVGILRSESSLNGNPHHASAVYQVYNEVSCQGERVKFINEVNPAAMNNNQLEILILPCANYLKESTIEEINTFIENGKTVLSVQCNDNCYNEDGKELSSEAKSVLAKITKKATFASVNGEIVADTNKTVRNLIKNEISLLEKMISITTDKDVWWNVQEYEDGYLVNICNLTEDTANITLGNVRGESVEIIDLIEDEQISENITLRSNETKFLKICAEENRTVFFAKNVGGEFEPTNKISSRVIKTKSYVDNAKPNKEVCNFLALYEGEKLHACIVKEGATDNDGMLSFESEISIEEKIDLSRCEIKSFLWEKENLFPLGRAYTIKGGN